MALGNLLLFVFVILEVFILKFYLKKQLPWKELIINLNSGHIVLWIFRGIEILGYYYTLTYLSLDLVENIQYGLLWVVGFVFWDFLFYWLHRTHHLFKILWSIHVVHHEGEHYSLSLGIRNSWYSSLSSLPYFVCMAVIGFPIEIFVSVSSIHYFIQFYNHNHIVKKSGWLEYIMITPSHHRVHHGKNEPYLDKNFGGTFLFWDKLFGTFQVELDENPVLYGTNDPVKSSNPLLINNIPFIKLAKPYQLDIPKRKAIPAPNALLVSGTFLLFSLLLFFIYFENAMLPLHKIIFFCTIFLGTLGIGLLSDNNTKTGVVTWCVSSILIPCFLLFNFPLSNLLFKTTLLITILHGVTSAGWFFYASTSKT